MTEQPKGNLRDEIMSKGILIAFGIGGLMFSVIIIGDLLT